MSRLKCLWLFTSCTQKSESDHSKKNRVNINTLEISLHPTLSLSLSPRLTDEPIYLLPTEGDIKRSPPPPVPESWRFEYLDFLPHGNPIFYSVRMSWSLQDGNYRQEWVLKDLSNALF